MSSDQFSGTAALLPGSSADRRAAVQREEQERAAARQRQIAAQSSPLNDPSDRIRIWEQLHGLRLPRAPAHKLVRVIATQTDLSVRQVQEEQRRRSMPAIPKDMPPDGSVS